MFADFVVNCLQFCGMVLFLSCGSLGKPSTLVFRQEPEGGSS
jgi:hypothetical protein